MSDRLMRQQVEARSAVIGAARRVADGASEHERRMGCVDDMSESLRSLKRALARYDAAFGATTVDGEWTNTECDNPYHAKGCEGRASECYRVVAADGSAAEASILRKAGVCPDCREKLPRASHPLARCWNCHHAHIEKLERACGDESCPEHGEARS